MMFYGCSSLNTVTTYANDISATDCRYNWLSGVANRGTFYNYGNAVYPSGAQGIPTNWTEMGGLFHIKTRYAGGTTTLTVNVRQNGTPVSGEYATSVQYSTDGSSWTTLDLSSTGTKTITIPSLGTVYFRNSSGYWSYYNFANRRYISFYCNKNFEVGGHLASLIDYTNLNVTIPDGSFYSLFYKTASTGSSANTQLLSSSKLVLPPQPGERAFVSMFSGCLNMTDTPELPTLTSIPNHCYQAMFNHCESITTPPAIHGSTVGTTSCYEMFANCTSLTTAPELPATTINVSSYRYMFKGCTSLRTAPELPATTLAETCYNQMFYGCSSLNSVTVYADDISATDCIGNWLYGVAASGTFHNLGSAVYSRGASGIPDGWVEVNN